MDRIDFEIRGADVISMFCRLNINSKRNLPIRAAEMGLLIYIVKNDNNVTPMMASDFFKVSKPMITTMIKSLLKKEYIKKVPCKEDKRSFVLVPELKGIKLVDETFEEYLLLMKMLMEGLGKEKFIDLIALIEEANTVLMRGRK